jgi:UDP-glucose 4-epimerase
MILITGGLGFIGSNLIQKLLESGYSLRIFDNFTYQNLYGIKEGDRLEIVKGDIKNYEELVSATKGVDAIIHLAAAGSVIESIAEPRNNFNTNVIGTFNVLEAAKESGVKKIVFSSTGGALIGNAPLPVNELSLPEPISPYGASKLACEAYIGAYVQSYQMQAISLRFANVIGQNSIHKKGLVTKVINALINNHEITIYGDGTATRDFIDVRDLCNGIELALKQLLKKGNNQPFFHDKYHLASGNSLSVRDLVMKLVEYSNSINPKIVYESNRIGEVEKNFAEFSKAKIELGFDPLYSIDESLRDTWEWISKNGA